MTSPTIDQRFLETTRGQIVSVLRRGGRTVEELATALGLSDNAVRNHLATLERDLVIRQAGVRRGGGAGKPAVLYELHPDAELLFSRAYSPVLTAVIEALVTNCSSNQTDELLRDVGRRLARQLGGPATGNLENRVRAAAAVLIALGGDVEVTREGGTLRIRASGCPLSATVSRRPELCRAVETLVTEVAGTSAEACCAHGDRPRCCFAIGNDA